MKKSNENVEASQLPSNAPSTRQEIGARRRQRMRQRLLESAARVAAEIGVKRATIEDYIQAAGVARGTFYNHYRTRDELLDDVWKAVGHDPFEQIRLACSALEDPAHRIAAWCWLVLNSTERSPIWGWVVYAFSTDEESVTDDLLAFPRPDLYQGQRDGRFHFEDLDCAVDLVVSSVRWAMRAVLTSATSPEYAFELSRMLLLALGLPQEEARQIAYGVNMSFGSSTKPVSLIKATL